MRSIFQKGGVALAALFVTAVPAWASSTTVLEVNVPFAFVVNGQNMPAGKYAVQRDENDASVLMIRGEHNNHAFARVLTVPDNRHDPAGSQPALTFTHREHQYQLAGVWQSEYDGWDVPR